MKDLEILKAQMQRIFFVVMVMMSLTMILTSTSYRDVLHPNRANVSKDELREKLAELYKANKDQVSVFGFRTQYGGGKSTGFALVYDSHEALKKFEPHYRLVRIGAATKIEKASRQQRTFEPPPTHTLEIEPDMHTCLSYLRGFLNLALLISLPDL
jgi:ribosomal protein S24E